MGLQDMQIQAKTLYEENLAKGMTAKDAAVDAQERTGIAMRTMQMIKSDSPKIGSTHKQRQASGFGVYRT